MKEVYVGWIKEGGALPVIARSRLSVIARSKAASSFLSLLAWV